MYLKQRRRSFKDAALVNAQTYFDYLQRFKKIALSIFEWQDLPDGMDAMFLEQCLYYDGKAAFLYDDMAGFMNLKASSRSGINMYNKPIALHCYSHQVSHDRDVYYGGKVKGKEGEKCIFVQNDWECIPTADTLELFALRMYECERAADVNIKQQKHPALVLCEESQRMTLKNLYDQVDGNEPVIFGIKNMMDYAKIQVYNTGAPYVADKLYEYKLKIWNEFLTFIGVNNLTEKKERMIDAETNTNNELVNLNLQSYLAPRKLACKQFNEKYGKNIDVKVRSDLFNIIKQQESIITGYSMRDDFDDATTDLGEGV